METDLFFGRNRRLNIFIYLLIFVVLQPNILYPQIKDSLIETKSFNLKFNPLYQNYQHRNDSIKISLKYKPKLNEIQFYNPKTVLPSDPMKIDYRHHPYYIPRMVDDFINMNIMDRPPSSSFVSLPTIALLAAAVAVQYISIKEKLELSATDYLIDDKYYPILLSLWKKSPQKAEELYLDKKIRDKRTMQTLITDLESLVKKRLLKTKKTPKSSIEYFSAQKKNRVIGLIENSAVHDDTQQVYLHKLKLILTTH